MMEVRRDALLERLNRQAELSSAPRAARLRHLPFRLVLPRLLDAAGLTWPVTAKTFFGRDMQVHLPDLVGVKLYQYGFFEEGLTRALIEKLRPGDSFVDIGAHVGYYTILASLLVGADGHVVAFEPTPRTRTELFANTAGLDNVQVVPMAAWDAAERLTLQDFGWRQSSFNSVVAAQVNGNRRCESIEVEAVAVDDWLAAYGIVPAFIKIDASVGRATRAARNAPHHRAAPSDPVARDRRLQPARRTELGRTHPLDRRAGIRRHWGIVHGV